MHVSTIRAFDLVVTLTDDLENLFSSYSHSRDEYIWQVSFEVPPLGTEISHAAKVVLTDRQTAVQHT